VQIDRYLCAVVVDKSRPGNHSVRFHFAVASAYIDRKPRLDKCSELV
jgi:hypothetical protein